MSARGQGYVLQVDRGSEPVTGRIVDAEGRIVREISGWLQATAALEWLASRDDDEPGES